MPVFIKANVPQSQRVCQVQRFPERFPENSTRSTSAKRHQKTENMNIIGKSFRAHKHHSNMYQTQWTRPMSWCEGSNIKSMSNEQISEEHVCSTKLSMKGKNCTLQEYHDSSSLHESSWHLNHAQWDRILLISLSLVSAASTCDCVRACLTQLKAEVAE